LRRNEPRQPVENAAAAGGWTQLSERLSMISRMPAVRYRSIKKNIDKSVSYDQPRQ
jgi:hypothetical protein